VPIVRTFITVTAGVGRMDYRVYTIYTVVGGILWGTGVTLLGYAMGNIAFVRNHIELILLGIVALSVLPIAVELLRKRRAPSP
jgi:membrane-associated protein